MSSLNDSQRNKVFLNLYSGAFLLSLVLSWIYSSYYAGDFPALLVFFGEDGNCDPITQGLGIHCFGDYSAIHFENLFQLPQGAETVYPLVTRVFRLPFLLVEYISGYRIGLVLYLATLFVAIIFPILHLLRKTVAKPNSTWLLLVVGTSVGTISCLDRGNVIGFAVPFVYLFLVKIQNNDPKAASIYLTIATMVKPQISLFAIAFLWQSELKVFAKYAIRTLFLLAAPYLVFGTRALQVFKEWIQETVRWASSLPPNVNFPTNYSFNRILGVFGVDIPMFSVLLGTVFLIGISLPYIQKKQRIRTPDLIKLGLVMVCMNSIVYVYYMVLITPLCAIMFTSFGTNSEDKTDLQTDSLFQALLLSMAMVPIAWPSRWKVMDTISSTEAYNQFPLVVTITIAVYITFAVTKNVLTLRLEQN